MRSIIRRRIFFIFVHIIAEISRSILFPSNGPTEFLENRIIDDFDVVKLNS